MRSGGGTGSALAFALAAVATSLAGAGVLTGATGATGAADAKFSCSRPSPAVVVWLQESGQEKAKKFEGEVEEIEEVRNGLLPLNPGSVPDENAEFYSAGTRANLVHSSNIFVFPAHRNTLRSTHCCYRSSTEQF